MFVHFSRTVTALSVSLLLCAWTSPTTAQQTLPPPVQVGPTQIPYDPTSPLPAGTIIESTGPRYPSPLAMPANSVLIPPLAAEVVWCQLVNVTDDFFKIRSEQRVVFAQGIPTEGLITTFPQTGATLLEPWRGDSVGFHERLESTLQSIRRIASIRLIPDPGGWRVEVAVQKELENLRKPMHATAGGATFRNDDSLYRYGTPLPVLGQRVGDQPRPVATPTRTDGWIPLGRDSLLERKILDKVLTRLGVAQVPQYQPTPVLSAN